MVEEQHIYCKVFFFADRLLYIQAVFRVATKMPLWTQGSITKTRHNLGMICTNILMNPTERITNRATVNFSGLTTYDIWSVGCIIYNRLFGPPLCNFDCQQINSLILFLYTIAYNYLQCLCFYFNFSQASLKMMRILENKD